MVDKLFNKEIQDGLQTLRSIRDEIQVQVHLAGMEMRERWSKLEPRFYEAEDLARKGGYKVRDAVGELKTQFSAFRDALRQAPKPAAKAKQRSQKSE